MDRHPEERGVRTPGTPSLDQRAPCRHVTLSAERGTYSGSGTFQNTDLAGKVLNSGTFTSAAMRIHVGGAAAAD